MAFYTYRQNNSGGYFVGPKYYVVEAPSADAANARLSEHVGGLSVEGRDCLECCGPRWSGAWSDDEGTLTPLDPYDDPFTEPFTLLRADGLVWNVTPKS